jgi:large subunit ribosomal protein L31
MKKDIHPTYFKNAKITCACGKVYEIGSTREEMQVELCAACHPFYTGKQKIIDTARRVEKFQERATKVTTAKTGKKTKKAKRVAQKTAKRTEKEKAEA